MIIKLLRIRPAQYGYRLLAPYGLRLIALNPGTIDFQLKICINGIDTTYSKK